MQASRDWEEGGSYTPLQIFAKFVFFFKSKNETNFLTYGGAMPLLH